MIQRTFWKSKIEDLWSKKNIIWLAGVRRVGKTMLCKSLPAIEYFDCELPRVRSMMEDPEHFLKTLAGKRVVLDEIHRLQNPSELLKIAADHFPSIKIIATGSSTLSASAKFRDSLSGRRKTLFLTPMISQDLIDFNNTTIDKRFLHGGLPPFFLLEPTINEHEYQDWLEAYWSKDILELFRLERRHSFLKFTELIFTQSGSMFDATRFAAPCEVSRTTISNYLSILEETFVAHVIRPYSLRKSREIVSAPKIYAFDTGFVCYFKGWGQLRLDDYGLLWEHYVLNEINGKMQKIDILYWRDKADHEIDFIIKPHSKETHTIECKWSAKKFSPKNLFSFRGLHPDGKNFVVCMDVEQSYTKSYKNLIVNFVSLDELIMQLSK